MPGLSEVAPRQARESRLVAAAWSLALRAHAGQSARVDGAPFLAHPAEVAAVVAGAGYDEAVVAAALLHDVVEDTSSGLGDVEAAAGAQVAGLVAALTEDPAIGAYRKRKAEHRARVRAAGSPATAIFAADKLANARALRRALERDPELLVGRRAKVTRKVEHYSRTMAMVAEVDPGVAFLGELRAELSRLERRIDG